jgi:hypothetical protein
MDTEVVGVFFLQGDVLSNGRGVERLLCLSPQSISRFQIY